MAYEELYPTRGPAPPEPKIVISPADIDISPQISLHTGRPNIWPVYFGARLAAQTIQDLLMKKMQVDDIGLIQNRIPGLLTTGLSAADAAKARGDTGDVANLKETIEKLYRGLYDNWKAGIWKGVGAAYSSAMDNFMSVGQLVYAYKTLAYHTAITPRMRRHWMSVYTPTVPTTPMAYNLLLRGKISDKQFGEYASYDGWDAKGIQYVKDVWTAIPNTRSAFLLHMRGVLDSKQFGDYLTANAWPEGWKDKIYKLYEALPTPREAFHLWTKKLIDTKQRDALYHSAGIDPGWYEKLTTNLKSVPSAAQAFWLWKKKLIDVKQRDGLYEWNGFDPAWNEIITANMMKLPTAHEAFYLWNKGLLDKAQRDGLYEWNGFDPAWSEIITANWQYVPSIYDLLRIADSVELDQIWALDVMKRRGVSDKDKAKIWEMLQIRPLREEVRELTKKWTWRMQFGRTTLETLEEEFKSLGIKTKERELLLKKAQMDYEDELITEYVEVLKWRFRTAIITAEEYLASLISTGIREEKANLIVELEQAMGYYGYY